MSEEKVESIFQYAREGAAVSIGSTRVLWQRVVDAIQVLRLERDEARKDASSCAAAHINAVAQLTEARRLLDDARAQSEAESIAFSAMRAEKERLQGIIDDARSQKPVAKVIPDIVGTEVAWLPGMKQPVGTELYAAAPVPAQPSAAVMCRFCGGETMHVGDICYGCAQKSSQIVKQPAAVPEAVAKVRIVEILNGERVENNGNPGDTGYNTAIDHCIAAILSADTEVKHGA